MAWITKLYNEGYTFINAGMQAGKAVHYPFLPAELAKLRQLGAPIIHLTEEAIEQLIKGKK